MNLHDPTFLELRYSLTMLRARLGSAFQLCKAFSCCERDSMSRRHFVFQTAMLTYQSRRILRKDIILKISLLLRKTNNQLEKNIFTKNVT